MKAACFIRALNTKGNINDHPEALREAYDLGVKAVKGLVNFLARGAVPKNAPRIHCNGNRN